MFTWRLQLREARHALAAGRLSDARRLLGDTRVRDFRPAKELAGRLAKAVEAKVQRLLASGDPAAASREATAAQRRGFDTERLARLAIIASHWLDSLEQARRGDMPAALAAIDQAQRLVSDRDIMSEVVEAIADAAEGMTNRAAAIREAHSAMHAAAADDRWGDALAAAEDALRLAPDDKIAKQLRRRAWKEVGLDATQTYAGRNRRVAMDMNPNRVRDAAEKLRRSTHAPADEDTRGGANQADLRMLWIDAVGGLLVVMDDEVMLGQPSDSTSGATLPILADISRRHAIVRREAGAYVLQPLGPTELDGKTIDGPTVLSDSHTIRLGSSVELKFTKPHALSGSARLDVVSHHQTQPSCDGVLLMADSCVLGPKPHAHVPCPKWKNEVVLFRRGDELLCRSGGELFVDGAATTGAVALNDGARIEGEDFSMRLETQ